MDSIGRYQIKRRLANGGMAEVYLAVDSLMGRDVAVKLLPKVFMHDQTFEKRFEQEARLLARLEHPAIVPVYDFGDHDGQPYMVSRLMKGGSLLDKITRGGALPLLESMDIMLRLCRGLTFAHEAGIIHRDIKPANILFDENGSAYVEDFGIAKLAESTSALTGNALIGTPAYMSPEQFSGEGEIDHRSDQYSLGIVLFEMLSGELPFKGDTTARLMKGHLMDPPPQLRTLRSELPEEIEPVIQRMLNKKPDKRYPLMTELTRDLEQIKRFTTIADPLERDYQTHKEDQPLGGIEQELESNSKAVFESVEKDIYTTNIIREKPPQENRLEKDPEMIELEEVEDRKKQPEVENRPQKSRLDLPFIGALWVIIIGVILQVLIPYGFTILPSLMITFYFAIKTRDFQLKRILSSIGINVIIGLICVFGFGYFYDYLYNNRFFIFNNTFWNNWENLVTLINLIHDILWGSIILIVIHFYRQFLDLRRWKRILAYISPLFFSSVILRDVTLNFVWTFFYDLFALISPFSFATKFSEYLAWLTYYLGLLLVLKPIFQIRSAHDSSVETTSEETL